MNLTDLPPKARAQAEGILKAQRAAEYPAFLEAARVLVDKAEAPKRERELLRLCCNDLCRIDVDYLHLSPKAREKKGLPDLVFFYAGRGFAIELKTATGIVSAAQKRVLERWGKHGAIVAVVRNFAEWRQVTGITGG